MNAAERSAARIARLRLHAQKLASPPLDSVYELVSHFGAVQAQDYAAMKWALGMRLRDATDATIDQAIDDGQIVRTWPMRGTLHVVAASDVRWIVGLCAPRTISKTASRYRQLELDDATLRRAVALLRRALTGRQLTRAELADVLERGGIATGGQRLIHIIQHASLLGLICHAARRGKQFTFALLDDWVPAAKSLARDDALSALVRRYFVSHGPATVRDFVWWSGLTVTDARAGLEGAAAELQQDELDGQTYWFGVAARAGAAARARCWLLPAFDEYGVAYTDRSAMSVRLGGVPFPSRGGLLDPVVVIDGQVVGTWRRTLQRNGATITIAPLTPLTAREQKAISEAAQDYARFIDMQVRVAL